MKTTNEHKDDLKKEIENLKKMEAYLKAKEEIFDFIIRNKTLKPLISLFEKLRFIFFDVALTSRLIL